MRGGQAYAGPCLLGAGGTTDAHVQEVQHRLQALEVRPCKHAGGQRLPARAAAVEAHKRRVQHRGRLSLLSMGLAVHGQLL